MDPLSPLETAFLALLSRPADYAEWAAEMRAAWLARRRPVDGAS